MTQGSARLKVGIVAGEESGDLLAADLVDALAARGFDISLVGVGGAHLQARGLSSLFDANELALMGVSAVIRAAPRIVPLIRRTAQAIAQARPDVLVVVDAPEFSQRVAKKVRALAPSIPVITYVCPSVWAWRPGRAAQMTSYVDHILCLLPFEPDVLGELGGPSGTYVGHRLRRLPQVMETRAGQSSRDPISSRTLVVLPGSRRGEINRHLSVMRETCDLLASRVQDLNVVVPTLPRLRGDVADAFSGTGFAVTVTDTEVEKWQAFSRADAALAASGTVTLELALCRVPHCSVYKLDPLARLGKSLLTGWSACLPNLVLDRPLIPEHYDHQFRAAYHARLLQDLMNRESPARAAQLAGLDELWEVMDTKAPAGEIAAGVVMDCVERATRQRLSSAT